MFLPEFADQPESWFSCDLFGSPGCLARLIPRVGCFFLSSSSWFGLRLFQVGPGCPGVGFPATFVGRFAAVRG